MMHSNIVLAAVAFLSFPFTHSLIISPDGTCAGPNGISCQGSKFGSCCSQFGHCGSTQDYCGRGCQSAFGACTDSAVGSLVDLPSSAAQDFTLNSSPDGTCGGGTG